MVRNTRVCSTQALKQVYRTQDKARGEYSGAFLAVAQQARGFGDLMLDYRAVDNSTFHTVRTQAVFYSFL